MRPTPPHSYPASSPFAPLIFRPTLEFARSVAGGSPQTISTVSPWASCHALHLQPQARMSLGLLTHPGYSCGSAAPWSQGCCAREGPSHPQGRQQGTTHSAVSRMGPTQQIPVFDEPAMTRPSSGTQLLSRLFSESGETNGLAQGISQG